jgi:hypothetical protein
LALVLLLGAGCLTGTSALLSAAGAGVGAEAGVAGAGAAPVGSLRPVGAAWGSFSLVGATAVVVVVAAAAGLLTAGSTSERQSMPMTLPGRLYWQTYVGRAQALLTAHPTLAVCFQTSCVKWPEAALHPGLLKL